MSKLTVTPFISKVFLMAYSNDIERLNEGIERRIHWRKEFLKRSSKAATKKLKAMWNNLSKGHLYQLNKLKSKRLRLVLSLSFGFVEIRIVFGSAAGKSPPNSNRDDNDVDGKW